MKEYIELGSAPCDEACVQVDSRREYLPAMVEECRRYKKLLEEMFSGPRADDLRAYFTIKSFPHDFGTYKEVCVVYDSDDEAAAEYAFNVEQNLPAKWEDSK